MIAGVISDAMEAIVEFFQGFLIWIVALVYNLVAYLFEIFTVLANTNIFKEHHYTAIMEKIYVILGVIMLFIMAYNFLMLVVDPDKNKSGATVEKLLKNIVTSFILIVVTPSLFTFAFDVQAAFIKSDIINNFFNSTNAGNYDPNKTVKEGGIQMAATVFESFFVAEGAISEAGDKSALNSSEGGVYTYKDGSGKTVTVDCSEEEECNLAEVKEGVKHGIGFGAYKAFALNVAGSKYSKWAVDFSWLISLVAGIYLAWVILSFCFDLAVRVVKLAFMQIIAPIAITARIIPDNDVFKNWWKQTLQTYTSVFIRIFIMHLGIYLIRIVHDMDFFQNNCDGCSWGVTLLGNAFIIMGVITFMKAASSLIDQIFGLGGDIKLGLNDMKDRLKGGGAFAAGAALGSGATSMTRNATHAVKNVKNAKGGWGKAAAVMRGIGSTATGAVTGAARGVKQGNKAGSWSEMVSASQNATNQTIEKRDNRESYRAAHGLRDKNGNVIPFVGGIGSIGGHISDAAQGVVKWAGINNEEEITRQNQAIMALVNAVDAVKDTARDVITSDALQKNKSNTYGIAATETWATSKPVGTDKHGNRVNLAYNTEEYRRMQQAIDAARAAGRDTVDYTAMDGNTYSYDIGRFQELQGLYLKEFSERVSNQAAKSERNWSSATDTEWGFDASKLAGLTGEALAAEKARQMEEYQLQLDKVRGQAITLRKELEDGINNVVISAANETAQALGTQQITVGTVANENLVFNGDSAISKLGDKAKLQVTANKQKLSKEQKKEDKK